MTREELKNQFKDDFTSLWFILGFELTEMAEVVALDISYRMAMATEQGGEKEMKEMVHQIGALLEKAEKKMAKEAEATIMHWIFTAVKYAVLSI